jgi:hypothetical protein
LCGFAWYGACAPLKRLTFVDGAMMKTFDIDQRIEEIQLALADLFESPKAPTVSVLNESDAVYLHLTWVVESRRDTKRSGIRRLPEANARSRSRSTMR